MCIPSQFALRVTLLGSADRLHLARRAFDEKRVWNLCLVKARVWEAVAQRTTDVDFNLLTGTLNVALDKLLRYVASSTYVQIA